MNRYCFSVWVAAIGAGIGCSGESSIDTSPSALVDHWDCTEIKGPVNDGPGVCPDCVAELCVEVTSSSELKFAVQVSEELPYPTELCSLDYVLVKQSSTTLYEDDIAIMPLELEEGFFGIGSQDPITAANASIGATIEAEGTFGRPTCD